MAPQKFPKPRYSKMEGSSLTAATGQEGSNPSLPMKINFSQLKCYFDRLDRRLKDPVLHTINDHVTELVQCLMDKQEIVFDKCCLILGRFFNVPIVENLEVAANTWEEVAMLNLLLRWFMSEEGKIEEKLTELIRNLVSSRMVSDIDIGHLFLSGEAALDARISQDSNVEDTEAVDQEPGHQAESIAHKEEMRTGVGVPESHQSEGQRVADDGESDHTLSDTFNVQELEDNLQRLFESEENYLEKLFNSGQCRNKEPMNLYYIPYNNYEWLNRILGRANKLENRMAFSLMDLFFLLKIHDQGITKIAQFKATLVGVSPKDEPWFIKEIVDLLELANEELDIVKGCWKLEGVNERNPNRLLHESMSVDKLLDQLTRLALRLNWEGLRRNRCLPVTRPQAEEDLASLDYNLAETEVELDWIEKNVDQLRRRVKDGRFRAVVTALGHAADCIIQSVKT